MIDLDLEFHVSGLSKHFLKFCIWNQFRCLNFIFFNFSNLSQLFVCSIKVTLSKKLLSRLHISCYISSFPQSLSPILFMKMSQFCSKHLAITIFKLACMSLCTVKLASRRNSLFFCFQTFLVKIIQHFLRLLRWKKKWCLNKNCKSISNSCKSLTVCFKNFLKIKSQQFFFDSTASVTSHPHLSPFFVFASFL